MLSKAAGFPINLSCLSAFGDISAPAIAELLRVASFKKIRAKSIVYREGEIASSITYILEGSLTAYRYGLDGRELVLDYLGRGDFVGEVPMLLANSNYKSAFKAREECKIAEIAVSDFQRICQRHPECLVRVAGQLAQRLNRSDDRIYDLVFLDVTARVENALITWRIVRQQLLTLMVCKSVLRVRKLVVWWAVPEKWWVEPSKNFHWLRRFQWMEKILSFLARQYL